MNLGLATENPTNYKNEKLNILASKVFKDESARTWHRAWIVRRFLIRGILIGGVVCLTGL